MFPKAGSPELAFGNIILAKVLNRGLVLRFVVVLHSNPRFRTFQCAGLCFEHERFVLSRELPMQQIILIILGFLFAALAVYYKVVVIVSWAVFGAMRFFVGGAYCRMEKPACNFDYFYLGFCKNGLPSTFATT
jgi:hypothetical protein